MFNKTVCGNPAQLHTEKVKGVEVPKKLKVNEIYGPTIQGEGKSLGKQVMFLRTATCNLACNWCFVGNTYISGVRTKKIKNIRVGDFVFTFDVDSNRIVPTKVLEVMQREIDVSEIISINASGKKIFCTKEHPFYVFGKGFVEAKNLKPKDVLTDISNKQLISLRMRLQNPMKRKEIAQKMGMTMKKSFDSGRIKPYIRTKEQKKWLSDFRKLNNPMKNPWVVKKNAERHFKKKSEIEARFEKICFESNFPVRYVGNNKLAIGDRFFGYRFPDFVVEEKDKVIELYDTTFLYSGKYKRGMNWIKKTRMHYKRFGYDCLFVNERDLKKHQFLVNELSRFCFNGLVVDKVSSLNKKQIARFTTNGRIRVYNLKTDRQTYIANRILVHNCDTPFTWNWQGTKFEHPEKFDPKKEIHELSIEQVIDELLRLGPTVRSLVISGGEPMLQQESLIHLLRTLKPYGYWIEIETNGTITPNEEFLELIDQINCSPKTSNSGKDNKLSMRERPEALTKLAQSKKTYFKFVVQSEQDMIEILEFVKKYQMKQVYLMPEGRTKEQQMSRQAEIVRLAEENGFQFSARLHILLWNTERRR